jgi:tRNA dimethylallyltransferase
MNHQPTIKTLIIIAGPTAVGKTAAAIYLAKKLNTVILSADSRQFYREMAIGTAKPTAEELAQAKHYFIDSHSVTETLTVYDFEQQALVLLDGLFQTRDVVIMVGGSGLFIRAITDGFDEIPDANPEIRERLNDDFRDNGIEALQEKLKVADPEYYATVDINNPQRIIRALEVFESTGQPFSSFRTSKRAERPFRIISIGLDMPREALYDRINRRVDHMIEQGLVDEVKSLLPYRPLNPLNTVGYTEIFDYLDRKIDLASAVAAVKQNTRRFAKRQLTWFRKDKAIHWFTADGSLYQNLDKFLIEQLK